MARFAHKRVSFEADKYKNVEEFKLAAEKHLHYRDIPEAIEKFKKLKYDTRPTAKKVVKNKGQGKNSGGDV